MNLISVDQAEINNWARIAVDLEVAGEVDSVLYERARAIALGQVDARPKYRLMLSEELPLAA
jgi:hypothetical protein